MQTFYVDQAKSMTVAIVMSCDAKTAFGSQEQERAKVSGLPKWTVQVVAGFVDQFGKSQNEVLKITMESEKSPMEGVSQLTPVKLEGLQIGVMNRTDREGNILGAQVYYKADRLVPAIQSVPAKAAS